MMMRSFLLGVSPCVALAVVVASSGCSAGRAPSHHVEAASRRTVQSVRPPLLADPGQCTGPDAIPVLCYARHSAVSPEHGCPLTLGDTDVEGSTVVSHDLLPDSVSLQVGSSGYRVSWRPAASEQLPVEWLPHHNPFAHFETGAPPPDQEADLTLVRALAATVLGWPGSAVVSRGLGEGEDEPYLAGALARLIDLGPSGSPLELVARVRSNGLRRDSSGEFARFDVSVAGKSPSTGDCAASSSDALLKGELLLGAKDGEFVALRLTGSTSTYETACAAHRGSVEVPQQPRPCVHAEVTWSVWWECGGTVGR
jgi:hypothetical protein